MRVEKVSTVRGRAWAESVSAALAGDAGAVEAGPDDLVWLLWDPSAAESIPVGCLVLRECPECGDPHGEVSGIAVLSAVEDMEGALRLLFKSAARYIGRSDAAVDWPYVTAEAMADDWITSKALVGVGFYPTGAGLGPITEEDEPPDIWIGWWWERNER